MSIDVMKQALEALEDVRLVDTTDFQFRVIAALREAIAETRQCTWPMCQDAEYQAMLAAQVKQELLGKERVRLPT